MTSTAWTFVIQGDARLVYKFHWPKFELLRQGLASYIEHLGNIKNIYMVLKFSNENSKKWKQIMFL